MFNLCAPAIIYLIFSITQILIDTYKGLYNTAGMKVIVATMVTLLLNIMCQRGLSVVSWIIVFIPFILMTVIVTLLLYAFGLDAAKGTIKDKTCKDPLTKCGKDVQIDLSGNVIVFDPEYDPTKNPVYYQKPRIIVPNPRANDIYRSQPMTYLPNGSTSPAYKS